MTMDASNTAASDLVAAASKVRDIAAGHAAEAETSRRLSPDVISGIRDAGFTRHFVPAVWGGREASYAELTQAVITVGEACASSAWCASVLAYSSRLAAHLPTEGQRALWSDGPDTFVVTALIPAGKADAAPGGWRLHGDWANVSGIEFADWAFVCGPNEMGTDQRFFALPREAFGITETWDMTGMQATASHTLTTDGAFVPEHLSFLRSDLLSGLNAVSPAPVHHLPLKAVGGLTFVPPALGAAYGALGRCAARVGGKPGPPGRYASATDIALARAAGQIDAARLLVERAAQASDGGAMTAVLAARNARDAALAGELIVTAVNGLLRAAGTGGLARSDALARHWRDVTCATSHTALRMELAAAGYSAVSHAAG
jgi:two-component flavin-dependent monooxygenase